MQLEILNGTYEYRSLFQRKVTAFDALSVVFSPGRTALIGPNGAGKSTLMSVATGLLPLAEGVLALDSKELVGSRDLADLRRATSFVPQRFTPIPGMTVVEHVVYAGWLKGLSAVTARLRAADALEQVNLTGLAKRPASRLSGGESRRLAIAQALVSEARFLFMDEPTAGLDPLQMKDFHSLLAGLDQSLSLIVSTHDINDINHRYDRVIVLNHGAIKFDDTIDAFAATAVDTNPGESAYLAAYVKMVGGPR